MNKAGINRLAQYWSDKLTRSLNTCVNPVLLFPVNSENKVGAVGFLPWFSSVLNPYYLIKSDPVTNEPIRGPNGHCIRSQDGEFNDSRVVCDSLMLVNYF